MTFSRRMLLVGGAQVALGAALIGRLGYLSVAENEHYQLLSESNRVQLIIVPPRRGWIVDRNGKPIAINRSRLPRRHHPRAARDIRPQTLRDRSPSCSSSAPTTSTGSSRI